MPIRLCQKCGLKVLIDESQSATNPFYCQRCTTAMKGGAEREDIGAYAAAPAAPPVRTSPLPTAAAAAATPSPVASGARPATIKVLCPYCKASFNGRVPQKPARGSCPVCQKELILLPDGDIRPSAGFDLNSWQSEKSGAEVSASKESGTQVLMRKYAAAPPPPPEAEPSPTADTDAPDESAALPSWLDDSGSAKRASPKAVPQPVPETDIEIDIVQPSPPAEEPEPVRLEDLPPPPVVPRTRPAARPAAAASSQSTAARPAVAAPIAAPKPESASGLRKPVPSRGTERKGSTPPPAVGAPAATGAGLYLLALLLVLAPVGTAGGLLGARDKMTSQAFVAKLGARLSKGLKALHQKLHPPEAPAPKPEEPKPAEVKPETPAQPTAEDQKLDEEAINKAWMEFKREDRTFKQKSVGATPAEKAEYKSVEDELKKKQTRIEEMKSRYQKLYGKSYDPRDQ